LAQFITSCQSLGLLKKEAGGDFRIDLDRCVHGSSSPLRRHCYAELPSSSHNHRWYSIRPWTTHGGMAIGQAELAWLGWVG